MEPTAMPTTKEMYLKEMREQGYSGDDIGDFHTKMIPYVLETYGVPKTAKIVEVGIAQGHCSISAYRAGYRNLNGVDYVDLNFAHLKEKFGIDCVNVDITKDKLPFADDSIDCFMFFHTIEHIADATLILSEMRRCTKPGGKCFIATPDWRKQIKTFFADPTHIKPYDKVSISRLMRIAGWENFDVLSFGTAYGLGRLKAYKYIPKVAFIGPDILVVATK
ncbi:MAG TPA: class I SAM-dependent methyltransferase [Polyangiaceae bacterium]|nr:class I SAM-dependent methyltransferase [Polyangiaceae bacterium]